MIVIYRLITIVSCGFLYAPSMYALGISPLDLDLTWPTRMAEVQVINDSNTELTVQIQIQKWLRKNGSDELSETRDIIASPPMAKIAAKGSQVVRIVRMTNNPLTAEESYRLTASEIPKPKNFVERTAVARFTAGFSIPVHFKLKDFKPVITWKAEKLSNRLYLQATNSGTSHYGASKVTAQQVQQSGKDSSTLNFEFKSSGRILPGATEVWVSEPIKKGFDINSEIIIDVESGAETTHNPTKILPSSAEFSWEAKRKKDLIYITFDSKGKSLVVLDSLVAFDTKSNALIFSKDANQKNLIESKNVWISSKIQSGFSPGAKVTLKANTSYGPVEDAVTIR